MSTRSASPMSRTRRDRGRWRRRLDRFRSASAFACATVVTYGAPPGRLAAEARSVRGLEAALRGRAIARHRARSPRHRPARQPLAGSSWTYGACRPGTPMPRMAVAPLHRLRRAVIRVEQRLRHLSFCARAVPDALCGTGSSAVQRRPREALFGGEGSCTSQQDRHVRSVRQGAPQAGASAGIAGCRARRASAWRPSSAMQRVRRSNLMRHDTSSMCLTPLNPRLEEGGPRM